MKIQTNAKAKAFLISLLLAGCQYTAAYAQTPANYCEPPTEVKDAVKKILTPITTNDELLFKQRQELISETLQKLQKQFPNDFSIRRRVFNERRYAFNADIDALISEFSALAEKNPNDPAAALFRAQLQVGRKTKDAIAQLEKLAQQSPDFPWTYLELAQIYSYPAFRDAAKMNDNLKLFVTKCPNSTQAISMLSRSGDQTLMRETAERLRARIADSAELDDLQQWSSLWSLEFKLRPLPEHAQLRQQVAEDVKQLRAKNLGTKEWLQEIIEGYRQANDKEGRRWAEDELLRLFPKSASARRMQRTRWDEANPRPKPNDSPEKKQAYYQALAQVTGEWLKQWPDDWGIWNSRYYAMEQLEKSSNAEVQAAAEGMLAALAKNQGAVYALPPFTVSVARTYAKRGMATERIPELIQQGIAEVEKREAARGGARSDIYPPEDSIGDNLSYVRWYSWPVLAEAHAKLKQPEKAREVLSAMVAALKAEKPDEKAKSSAKSSYTSHQVTYWETVGKVSEAESRKLDALTAYQTAMAFRPKKAATAGEEKKDELADNARRLWKELGGTDDGWQAYLARNEASRSASEATESTWDTRNQTLPDFTLADLQGKTWKLADLKGKTTFINLWATWCGPCIQELPYVQKLHEQMKDRKDVLILTLNIDEELGLVEPFMKDNKYNFTVLPAQSYATNLGVYSIPRNWVVSVDGVLQLEGIGYGGEGDEWLKKVTGMIEKVKSGGEVKK